MNPKTKLHPSFLLTFCYLPYLIELQVNNKQQVPHKRVARRSMLKNSEKEKKTNPRKTSKNNSFNPPIYAAKSISRTTMQSYFEPLSSPLLKNYIRPMRGIITPTTPPITIPYTASYATIPTSLNLDAFSEFTKSSETQTKAGTIDYKSDDCTEKSIKSRYGQNSNLKMLTVLCLMANNLLTNAQDYEWKCPMNCDCADYKTLARKPQTELRDRVIPKFIPSNLPFELSVSQDSKYINCSRRNLISVPKDIHSESILVDISRNNITFLSKMQLMRQKKLVYLNASYNLIESIPSDTFYRLTNLKILDLSNNPIKEYPQTPFRPLRKLQFVQQFGFDLNSVIFEVSGLKCSVEKLIDRKFPIK